MSQLAENILAVLSTLQIEGCHVKITEQLDRPLYQSVDEVLKRIGGKWNKKAKAHIFNADPTDLLNVVIESGMLDPKVKTGYFPTPPEIVDRMINLADLGSLHSFSMILEPSAGQGHILDKITDYADWSKWPVLHVCENLPENIHILEEKGYEVSGEFFEYVKECNAKHLTFERILMNPPFERQADITHVTTAFNLLAPGGILVTIMSAGVLFRENKKTVEFREGIMEVYGTYLDRLPEGAFKESGTMVNTVLLRLER